MSNSSVVNIPPKTILSEIVLGDDIVNDEYWPYPNGTGDRWWVGGSDRQRYRWVVTLNITVNEHGSHLTPNPFVFDGRDIDVGDWIASTSGRVWYIRSVISKESNKSTVIIEDWNRYNTFNSDLGNGRPITDDYVIFETNEVGEPMFAGLPIDYVYSEFYANVNSYFKYVNPCRNFTVQQKDHNFKVGQKLSIKKDSPNYTLTDNDNVAGFIGTVSQVFSNEHFMFEPNTKIAPLKSAYGFDVGARLYFKNNKLTEEKGSRLFYTVLAKEKPSSVTGKNVSPTLIDGSKFRINDYEVTTGTDIPSVVDFINNDSSNVLYTASEIGTPTVVERTLSLSMYGLVGAYVPFSAEINGSLVVFDDSTNGSAAFGGEPVANNVDMVNSINAANIDGIVAETNGSRVNIINQNGGEISIVNIQNDPNGVPFAGTGSATGLELYTAPSQDTFLRITRLDGGELRFSNVTGSPVEQLGLLQSRSGQYPIVLVAEQGIRKGDTYVVETMSERDGLDVIVGDQAFVLDSGNGEWSKYMFTTTGWILVATQDSARTDADVLTLTLTHEDSAGDIVIGTVSDNSRIIDISIKVREQFNIDAMLDVGDSIEYNRIISDDIIDLTREGVYSNTPSYVYSTGGDTDIIARFDPSGSTTGEVKIVISYT